MFMLLLFAKHHHRHTWGKFFLDSDSLVNIAFLLHLVCSGFCSKEYQGHASNKFQVVIVTCALRSSLQRMVPRLAGQEPDPATDAWTYLITVCTGFVFNNSDNEAAKFALQAFGPIYTWITNPTSEALVKKIAALEGGSAAVAVSYSHAAQLLAFSNIFQPGDHFIATDELHGGTYHATRPPIQAVWLGDLVLRRRRS